jgi:redox-sensitive bicupin YhaK (pirin superfamily)
LIEPHIQGDSLKPFVALARFEVGPQGLTGFNLHPHSGIATFTLMVGGSVAYQDSTGAKGQLAAGGLGWLRAGAGAWHLEEMVDGEPAHGFQLWLALPQELEHAPPDAQYLAPNEVATAGPARIALGQHAQARSPVRSPGAVNYLYVRLRDGELWHYQPPVGHTVAWVFPFAGQLRAPQPIETRELVQFEESNSALTFVAVGDTELLLGSAARHRHELVLGHYCVHTSVAALTKGKAEIERIGRELLESGKLDATQLNRALERIQPGNW